MTAKIRAPDYDVKFDYKYGFHDDEAAAFKAEKGLSERVVRQISEMKGEPE